MKKTSLSVLTVALILAIYLMTPTIRADSGNSNGTANIGNSAPTVSSPGLWDSGETTDKNNSALTVQVQYRYNISVTDNNQLYNIRNVTFYVFEDNAADPTSADANETHYTFVYLNSTDAFDEIGPDGSGNGHLISGSCSKPADRSQVTGVYKLAFQLEKTANNTGSTSWRINCTVFDNSNATANNQDIIFSVNAYYEITVSDSSHGWSASANSNDNQINPPADGDIDIIITANSNFKLQAKGDADLTSGGDTIELGNVTIHEDTLGSSVALTTNYADIGGLTSEERGWAQAKSCILWLDVPAGTPDGSYTYTLSIQVTGA